LFFVISRPQSGTFINDEKRQHQINAINDGSSSEIVVHDNEHTITLPVGEKL
jgi:hypothetical protein